MENSQLEIDITPVTEQSNAITTGIDIASSADIVRLIGESDAEIFASFEGLLSKRCLAVMDLITTVAASLLQDTTDRCKIVISGCGTSGRLAFLTARSFNEYLKRLGRRPMFEYLIAGTDRALFVSQELTEDDPITGRTELEEVTAGCTKVLYIGITCGLSAPYVAGQLDYCMEHLDIFIPVLIGFNYLATARNIAVENWNKTFLQVANRLALLEETKQGFILNPIIGPEPITGSTRMKSGTATKILLESIFTTALQDTPGESVGDRLIRYRAVQELTYSHADHLAGLLDLGGHCLKSNGHIYYVSDEKVGILGLIDASECPPTYGCHQDDVRGFITGGYGTLCNKEGDMSQFIEISMEYFTTNIVPTLTNHDLLVFIAMENLSWLTEQLLSTQSVKCLLRYVDRSDKSEPISDTVLIRMKWIHNVQLPLYPGHCSSNKIDVLFRGFLAELACKLTCNLLTTGAHILKGKVWQNYMIDLKVRNNKLFHRAVAIVQKFGSCTKEDATICLLRSIYGTDLLSDSELHAEVSQHISQATLKDRVIVPVAIILAKLHGSISQAEDMLAKCPILRLAISSRPVSDT